MGPLSLFELNNRIRGVIEDCFDDALWVTAEIVEARPGPGGHFYGELGQRDERTENFIAKARFNIWARNYQMLRLRFERETGETLRSGLKLLLLVKVTFHELYGYSLNVLDVDPSYTIGDMARRRQEILRRIEKEGILNDNKTLPLPMCMQRVAIISSDNAAGYGDFCDQLLNNDYGLHFYLQLFPAAMQGARVEESILAALEGILSFQESVLQCSPSGELEGGFFDCVVIIRGGGATSDLSDFDSYNLASAIAQFPLPVFVGIGHERDETVLDYVAHTALKTPTAVAAFIIDHQAQQLVLIDELGQRITNTARNRLHQENVRISRFATFFPLAFARLKERHLARLQMLHQRLSSSIPHRLERERHRIDLFEQRFKGLDPDLLLKRGYTITTCNGKIVRSPQDVRHGDTIVTRTEGGEITSIIL